MTASEGRFVNATGLTAIWHVKFDSALLVGCDSDTEGNLAHRKGFSGLLNGTRHIARRAFQKAIDRPEIRSRSGTLSRLARYPNPLSAPWRRKIIDVLRRGAIGDVLMCTPALRELKQKILPVTYDFTQTFQL